MFRGMEKALVSSLVLHVLALVLFIGLPFFGDSRSAPQPSISVEIVKIGPKTQGPTKKATKKTAAKTPPKKETPKKSLPKPKQEQKKTADKPQPKEQPKAVPIKKKEPPKPEKKEPQKQEPVKKEEPKKEEEDSAFDSVLKNLEDLKPEEESKKEDDPKTENTSLIEPAEELTISERDAVSRQFIPCWSLLAGGKDAENMVIDIKVSANPDGTVREAHIVNTARMAYDKTFEAAALSARRAVLNPKCSPLKLPAEKYTQWKNITLRFNPKHMF